jgi:hypothetical protein
MKKQSLLAAVFVAALLAAGCHVAIDTDSADLTGSWRSDVVFTSGAYADPTYKGVKFLYAFNPGGSMMESANYDAVPPVPPAYGVWEKTGRRQFVARYEFFITKPPASFDELAKGGGWMPDGHGVVTETITLSADGNAFDSQIKYELFDAAGKPIAGGGEAASKAERIRF